MDDILDVIEVLLRTSPVEVIDFPVSFDDRELGFVDINGDRRIDILDAMFALVALLDSDEFLF